MNKLREKYKDISEEDYFYYCIGLKRATKYCRFALKNHFDKTSDDVLEEIANNKYIKENHPLEQIHYKTDLPFKFRFQKLSEAQEEYYKTRTIDPEARSMMKKCLEIFRQDLYIFSQFTDLELKEISSSIKKYNLKLIDKVRKDLKENNTYTTKDSYEKYIKKLKDRFEEDSELFKSELTTDLCYYKKWFKDGLQNNNPDYSYWKSFNFEEDIVDPAIWVHSEVYKEMYDYLNEKIGDFKSTILPDDNDAEIIDSTEDYPDISLVDERYSQLYKSENILIYNNDITVNQILAINKFNAEIGHISFLFKKISVDSIDYLISGNWSPNNFQDFDEEAISIENFFERDTYIPDNLQELTPDQESEFSDIFSQQILDAQDILEFYPLYIDKSELAFDFSNLCDLFNEYFTRDENYIKGQDYKCYFEDYEDNRYKIYFDIKYADNINDVFSSKYYFICNLIDFLKEELNQSIKIYFKKSLEAFPDFINNIITKLDIYIENIDYCIRKLKNEYLSLKNPLEEDLLLPLIKDSNNLIFGYQKNKSLPYLINISCYEYILDKIKKLSKELKKTYSLSISDDVLIPIEKNEKNSYSGEISKEFPNQYVELVTETSQQLNQDISEKRKLNKKLGRPKAEVKPLIDYIINIDEIKKDLLVKLLKEKFINEKPSVIALMILAMKKEKIISYTNRTDIYRAIEKDFGKKYGSDSVKNRIFTAKSERHIIKLNAVRDRILSIKKKVIYSQ